MALLKTLPKITNRGIELSSIYNYPHLQWVVDPMPSPDRLSVAQLPFMLTLTVGAIKVSYA